MGGLVCVLLALLVLPWFSIGGQEVALDDLRTAFTSVEGDDTASAPGAEGPSTTLPEGGVPSAGESPM